MPLAMNPNKSNNIDIAAAVKVKDQKKRKPTIKSTAKSIIKSKPANSSPVNLQYIDMIREAIENLKSLTTYAKRGVSQQAIKKYIKAKHEMKLENVADKNFFRFTNLALKRAVSSHILIQVKGVGANGSFKLAIKDKPKKPAKAISKKMREINRKPTKTVVSIKKSAIKQATKTKSTTGKKTNKKTVNGKKARALVKKVTKIKKIK